jgi:CBS domain-containing protein
MPHLKAKDVMTREVKTVTPQATLREAAELLATQGISGAPVVDETGRVVGVISESDILDSKKRYKALPRMALWGLRPIPEDFLREAYQEGLSLQVESLMSRNVITAEEETPLEELAHLMVSHRINRVPILREGKLVGIVTREDALRGLLASSSDKPPA